jgi:hypothetical protein
MQFKVNKCYIFHFFFLYRPYILNVMVYSSKTFSQNHFCLIIVKAMRREGNKMAAIVFLPLQVLFEMHFSRIRSKI